MLPFTFISLYPLKCKKEKKKGEGRISTGKQFR